ncbi:hypothetical protein Hanom_Chr13g01216421 [Helianthus anomalus]
MKFLCALVITMSILALLTSNVHPQVVQCNIKDIEACNCENYQFPSTDCCESLGKNLGCCHSYGLSCPWIDRIINDCNADC